MRLHWMRGMVGGLVMGVCLIVASTAVAEERSLITASGSCLEGRVAVAVHPYFTKEERAITSGLREKHIVPIGVLVQNYGATAITLESPVVVTMDRASGPVVVRNYVPYGDRPVGVIASSQFFIDGRDINVALHAQRGGRWPLPNVGVNETFHPQSLQPGEAFYGLVFVEARRPDLQPRKLRTLQGLHVSIPFASFAPINRAAAIVSLDGRKMDPQKVEQAVLAAIPRRAASEPRPFEYIGSSSKHPDARTMYEVHSTLADCFAQRVGKIGTGKFRHGEAADIDAIFTQSGEYISHTLRSDSSSQRLVPKLGKLVRGMKQCALPGQVVGQRSAETHRPYYRMRFGIGDPAVKEARRESQRE